MAESSTLSALKQPMAGVAVLFALGIVVGQHVPGSPLPIAVAALLGCVRGLISTRRALGWLGASLVLAGWADVARQTAVLSPWDVRERTGESAQLATLHGTLLETPRIRLHGLASRRYTNAYVTLDAEAAYTPEGGSSRLHGKVQISTPGLPAPGVHAGRRVAVSGVLRLPPPAAAPGLFNSRKHLAARGIHRELRASSTDDWSLLDTSNPARVPWADRFQEWARTTLARGSPGEDDALRLLWAMTLGWKTAMVDEVEEPFLRSGTLHVFAISGLHIALIANVLIQVLRLFLLPRFLAGLIALPTIWLYVAATGWQSSAVRSAVMSSMVIGSWMCSRPVNLLNSLATAAFAVLVWDPIQLLQAGFQLSFAVVACIGLLAPQFEARLQGLASTDPFLPADTVPAWRRVLERVGHRIGTTVAVSAAAWVGSVPLGAWHFNLVTPAGLVANLVVVPLSSCALASSLASLACGPWLPGLGECFGNGAWFWMAGMLAVSRRCAELPFGCWQVRAPPVLVLILAYTLILLAAGGAWRSALGRRRALVLVSLLVAGSLVQWRLDRVDTRIGILAIRGGHSVCVQTARGTSVVDTGDEPGARTVVHPYLKARGVNRLREIWLSHGDVRHVGGTHDLLQRYAPGSVRISPLRFRSGPYRALVDSLSPPPSGILRTVRMGDSIGPWHVLHPAASDKYAQADDGSLVLRFGEGPESVLMVGDLGRPGQEALLQRHPELRAGIVISGVPTRGEPLGEGLLDRLQPRMVIVVDATQPSPAKASAACKARLRARPMSVWFTSETGSLELRESRGRWEIRDAEGRSLGRLPARTSRDRFSTPASHRSGASSRANQNPRASTEKRLDRSGLVLDETRVVSRHEVKNRHPHGEAVGDLFKDDGLLAVRRVGIDLHAPVDGARMHDQNLRLQTRQAGAIEAEFGAVLADPGEHGLLLALMLNPEEVHDVGVPQTFVHVPAHATTHLLEDPGHQGGRTAEGDLRSQLAKRPDVGARDTAEEDVPHDGHLEAVDASLPFPDGEEVEKRLRGMFVGAVAGVHDARLKKSGQEMGRARRAMTDHDDVGAHRLQVASRVAQRFALLERGGVRAEIDDVRRQALGRELEADPGARGRFDEEVDHRLTPEGGDRLDRPGSHRLEAPRGIENGRQLLRREGFDVEKVASGPGHGVSRCTRSSPPVSVHRTSTLCSGRVSRRRAK